MKFILILLLLAITSSAQVKDSNDVLTLYMKSTLDKLEQQKLISFINKKFKDVDLSKSDHRARITRNKKGGGTAAWFMKAASGSKLEIFAEKKRQWPMKEIGKSGLYFAAEKFPNWSSVHFHYTVNGKRFKHGKLHRFGFESYTWTKDSLVQDGVPQGKVINMGIYKATDEFYPGTERQWWVYLPKQYKKGLPVKLIVYNDGRGFTRGVGNACTVMDNLIHQGKMPVSIAVFVNPGIITRKGKSTISSRGNEYDTCLPKFANFLEKEILSQVFAKYTISPKAEDHAIVGASSGGSCAFTAAWHRNDLFTKVISFVGSFCDFRPINDYPLVKGLKSEHGPYKTAHDYPALIRKTNPAKNIRVFLQDGDNDLDNGLGNWFQNNLRMEAALAFSAYQHKAIWGKGMHSRKHGMALLPEALEWLWANKN